MITDLSTWSQFKGVDNGGGGGGGLQPPQIFIAIYNIPLEANSSLVCVLQ